VPRHAQCPRQIFTRRRTITLQSIQRVMESTQNSTAEDIFADVGKRVETLATEKVHAKSENAATGNDLEASESTGDDNAKVVEEIESLCMNCRENVSYNIYLKSLYFS